MEKKTNSNPRGDSAFLRFFRPSMRMYFCILVFFAILTLAFRHWELGILELLAAGLLLLYSRFVHSSQERKVLDYLGASLREREEGNIDTILTMPLPMVVFNLKDGTMLWGNDAFLEITGERRHLFEITMADMVPGFSLKWLSEGHKEASEPAVIGDRKFRVYGNRFSMENSSASGNNWGITYFMDVTEYERISAEYTASRPVVSVIMLDNYDELIKNLNETAKSAILAQIDHRISEWTAASGGYICRYDRDRYIFIFEERNMQGYIDGHFSLLDSVRGLQSPNGITATVSIGLGRGAGSLEEAYQFAMLGIEMALSRGGDQAVIKTPLNFEFYGGKAVAVERRTKVKSRVMASALGELMGDASNILVMGHKFADLDSVGAAAGICCIARKMEKSARIVMNKDTSVAMQMVQRLQRLPEYADVFIGEQEGFVMADGRTLLVVVDTNRPDQVESEDLLMSCNKIAVIDHHRRAADYIANAALNFHEPYASSASELVTELMQYLVETADIRKTEAEAVLAGIVLDTKNFTMRTGSRTFEAAAFLRRCSADTTEVKKLLQNDLRSTVARFSIVEKAVEYKPGIAVAEEQSYQDRIIAAQAADELVNISGIDTSFVVFKSDETVNISARSIGDVNVQVILEKLGGGGNRSGAGAQIRDMTVAEVSERLKRAIDEYLSSEEGTEGKT
ncbi:MAG: DHH family phosphoesterase [Oscillospiraceae bacterium]|nr:DHH family phosphoesterase [Oscillospiraceae bacterium]